MGQRDFSETSVTKDQTHIVIIIIIIIINYNWIVTRWQ